MLFRSRQILKLIGEGVGTIADMVPKMYAGIDARLYGAAGRSVLAHLIDLRDRGMASERGGTWR